MRKNKLYLLNSILLISTIITLISCKNYNRESFYKNIEKEQELQTALIFSIKKDSISFVNYNILKDFFSAQEKSFKYKNFDELLLNINKISNKEKRLLYFSDNYKFDENSKILENLSTDEIAKKLKLDKTSKNGYYVSPSKYSKEVLYSILYLFYKNNQFILYDDDIGQYLIVDLEKRKSNK